MSDMYDKYEEELFELSVLIDRIRAKYPNEGDMPDSERDKLNVLKSDVARIMGHLYRDVI